MKVFDALAVYEVPECYILPRWLVEPMDDENIEVVAESLHAQQLTDQGQYIVRYSRICNGFSNIVRPFIGDEQGYDIITRHMAAMQSELCAMNKRRVSTLDSAAGVGGSAR
jgi:hypothetical protein